MSETLEGVILGGKYKIIKRLGRGGMAEVYLANQENLDRQVAVKLMHAFLVSEQDFLHRFKREARAMAAMNHPNIVAVYDFDIYGENTYYLVIEYISGGSLKEKLAALAEKNEQLPLKEAIRLALQVAEALDYAHSRNMIHRDVKPANILLNERGDAILTDFGIVKLVGAQSMAFTATGALVGTPAYMSPEQAMGKRGDSRSDLYSLGVLLFQMVTGQLPFDADTPLAVVMKHVNDPVPNPASINPNLPVPLKNMMLKSLAKDPEKRYQTAGELAADLRSFDIAGTAPRAANIVAAAPGAAASKTEVLPPPSPGAAGSSPLTQLTQPGMAQSQAPAVSPPQPDPSAVTEKKKSGFWLFGIAGIVLVGLILAAVGGVFSGNRQGPEPTAAPIVAVAVTNTQAPSPTSSATATPTTASTPPPDATASARALVALTETAVATPSPTPAPSSTPTVTFTPEPDLTAQFLDTCNRGVELVTAYTYGSVRFTAAPINATFPANWVLQNSGTCPWPENLEWRYLDGEDFRYGGDPIPTAREVGPNGTITLTAALVAPASVNTFFATWQLVDEDGEPFAPPVEFSFSTYIPATATPVSSPTPDATPTPEATEELPELNYAFEILSCEYVGIDWRCTVRLTPYGGGGGPYTVLVLDQPAGQATEFRGPWPATYFAQARRCAAFNSEVRVIDDASATEFSRHLYIDPDDYIAGGCTE